MNQVHVGNYFDGNYFFQLFSELCLPFAFDIGKIILFACIIQGAYLLMRNDTKASLNKIKYAVFGYIALRFTAIFISMIDQIATQITGSF